MVEETLRVQAWHHPSLGMLLAKEGGQPCKMENLYFRFTPLHVSWLAGEVKTRVCFEAVLLKWPRSPGALVMLKLATIYDAMGLTQFGGKQWKWVNSGFKPWKRALAALGLQSHLLASYNMKVVLLFVLFDGTMCVFMFVSLLYAFPLSLSLSLSQTNVCHHVSA